jgi:hypothetical protein
MSRSNSTANPEVPSLYDVRDRLQENFRRLETLLRNAETGDDPRVLITAAAELRQHIALAEKALDTAIRADAVRAFEDAVLDAIGEASATVRRRVIAHLNQRAAGFAHRLAGARTGKGAGKPT